LSLVGAVGILVLAQRFAGRGVAVAALQSVFILWLEAQPVLWLAQAALVELRVPLMDNQEGLLLLQIIQLQFRHLAARITLSQEAA
jgi:hypothetical protein